MVDEVRSDEIIPMLDAMASGGDGSLCTCHVQRGVNPLTRTVSLVMRGADALSEHEAHQLIATAVDLIVHLDLYDEPNDAAGTGGGRRRVVGEGGRIATAVVFAPGPDRLRSGDRPRVPAGPPSPPASIPRTSTLSIVIRRTVSGGEPARRTGRCAVRGRAAAGGLGWYGTSTPARPARPVTFARRHTSSGWRH